tara:strand:+ start:530 stop:703 length:174 start_codon:yes stop_codon:yes gene_type:complete
MESVLDKVIVNIPARKFSLLSNEMEARDLICEDADQFQRVLDVVRATCSDDEVQYIF